MKEKIIALILLPIFMVSVIFLLLGLFLVTIINYLVKGRKHTLKALIIIRDKLDEGKEEILNIP